MIPFRADGSPDPLAHWWVIKSAPAGTKPVFSSQSTRNTTVSGLTLPGTYVFTLRAMDRAAMVTHDVTVTVNPSSNQAPSITTQPSNQTVNAGQTATFTVTATGTAPLTYQWSKNGTPISGATSTSYTTPATALADSGSTFTVAVSNSVGNVKSNAATLTVNAVIVAPSITSQPANQTVTAGQTATFSIVASGTAPLSYQWQKNGVNISSATAASYTTPATATSDNGSTFCCVASNSAGSATSNSATLTVNAISASYSINSGGGAVGSFSADNYFSGGSTYSTSAVIDTTHVSNPAPQAVYQSERYGNNTYTFPNLTANASYLVRLHFAEIFWTSAGSRIFNVSINGTQVLSNFDVYVTTGSINTAVIKEFTINADARGKIAVVYSNVVDQAKSSGIEILSAANLPPVIMSQPANQTVTAGQTAIFSVVASGTAPLTYQWQKNGVNVAGATSASYTTPATVAADNASTFKVLVSNSVGSIASNSATLTVNTANQPPVIVSAAAASPNPAFTGQVVTFGAAASDPNGDPLNYLWSFGDGATGSAASATHAYATAGVYTATVNVTDGRGGSVSSSVTVSITASNGSTIRINSGGVAAGTFVADSQFSGGSTYSTTAPINAASVATPAPQSVYQTERYGNFSYTVSGLTPNAAYLVRLHFAEIYWNSAGQRLFNVSINAQQALSNFDIFAAAGGKFIAIIREFNVTANDSGQVVIIYSTLKDNAKSSGVEVLSSTPTMAVAASDAVVAPDTVLSSIDLGTVKLNQSFKLKLEAPEVGSLAKKLRWSLPKGSALPKGVKVSGGILGGKAHALGTFTFKLQVASKGGDTTNSYTLTVTR
jgi:hypothetical protein